MSDLVYWIWLVVSAVAFFYLVFPFLTVLVSVFRKEKMEMSAGQADFDFGCIITAYRNAEISKPLIQSLLSQKHQNLHVYLVADDCDVQGFGFSSPKFTLLRPAMPLNLKAKSIIHAVEHFCRSHDFIAIFDADNLAHPEFFTEVNRYANAGYLAIQGRRTAKNLNTTYAAMDALGEFYKNYIERYVTYLLGSSAVISGSGMAVEAKQYIAYLHSPEIERGKTQWKKMLQEDKILQNFLLRQNQRIAYAWDAICYDEKVTTAQAVETQRSRWLFSYFQNLPNSLGILRRGLLGLSWNQIYFGLVTLAPPLFILLAAAIALCLVGLLVQVQVGLALLGGVVVFAGTILWTLHLSKVPEQVWKSIWNLPLFILRQMTALLKIKDPNKNFKHTEHSAVVEVNEVLSQKL
jgi:cellulose synthase/poly-beta-1,6-N-acetylglucosamine synthase-like glycosyltransferase